VLPNTGPITISGFCKSSAAGNAALVTFWYSSAGYLGIWQQTGGMWGIIRHASSSQVSLVSGWNTSFQADAWMQYAFVKNASGEWVMYARFIGEGSWKASASKSYAFTRAGDNVYCGQRGDGALLYDGRLAIVGCWDSDLMASGALDSWFASPGDIPAGALHLYQTGNGTDAPPDMLDYGSVGGYGATMINGPTFETDFPGVTP